MAQLIDIEAVVRAKFPRQYPKVPRWVFRLAAWLICQKQMNRILIGLDGTEGTAFADGMTRELRVSYRIEGLAHLDAADRDATDGAGTPRGRIFVSNHPLGAFDGISYIKLFGRRYEGRFKVIVNDLLMHIVPLRPVFLPVNTMGRQRREDLEAVEAAYADPTMQLLTFPAGFCSRWMGGRIQDVAWRDSVIKQAVRWQRDVVPLHFEGRNSVTFYAVEWLRRVCGMKFNIGLVLLPWQMMKTSRGKTYTIRVGRPIPWQTFDRTRTTAEWAAWLRAECYRLKNAEPAPGAASRQD